MEGNSINSDFKGHILCYGWPLCLLLPSTVQCGYISDTAFTSDLLNLFLWCELLRQNLVSMRATWDFCTQNE